jgi:4-hydroxy-tetrahydrodipicolinate synthase
MFTGVYTAIVTPFREDGEIDLDAFRELINLQAESGVDGIVPVGTTGESPTLDFEEHSRVIAAAVDAAAGSMQVVAGTGGNATSEALRLTSEARDAGADGTLQVTPYYNKPSQEGLYRHFSAIADLGLPVVLYNIPGRTSLEISLETVVRLAEHPHVVAMKEAGGGGDRVRETLTLCDITILSGDDDLTLEMMEAGARGVISVASNVAPQKVCELVHAAADAQWDKARDLHNHLMPLFSALFSDTNPIPVKAALAMQGRILETYRLPLCEMADNLREELRQVLRTQGLIAS